MASNAENVSIWWRHHGWYETFVYIASFSHLLWSMVSGGIPAFTDWAIEHDDVIKWKYFPRYWPFVRGFAGHRWIPRIKGQWRRTLIFSLTRAWTNGWENNGEAGDLRLHRGHYDVIVMSAAASATMGSKGDYVSILTLVTVFSMFQLLLLRWVLKETTSVPSLRRAWRKPRRNSMKIQIPVWKLWKPCAHGLNNSRILDAKPVWHCVYYSNFITNFDIDSSKMYFRALDIKMAWILGICSGQRSNRFSWNTSTF